MKQGCLAVCLWLVVAQSASAIFAKIDRQLTTPNLLVFDIGWELRAEQTGPGENSFLDQNGNLLWHVAIKDQNLAQRLIDVDVLMQDPLIPRTQVRDSWSFFYDERRRFDTSGYWQRDAQHQTGERIPPPPMDGVVATFTLVDPYSARVTYVVPEPSVLALGALFAVLYISALAKTEHRTSNIEH